MHQVRNQRCQWVPDLLPIERQENISPYLDHDQSSQNVWEYLGRTVCQLSFGCPFLDGAEERM
eukprot:9361517-Pyramimonas_sp.AAC.1